MNRKIIVFRFDTLSTLQCYSTEVTLKVDANKTLLQCWKDYLALEVVKTIDDVIDIVKRSSAPSFVGNFIPTNEKY